MNTLHGESWKYSTRTVQSRRIKLCFTYNRLHTVSIYHVEAIRKWSYVNSKYCSHHQWKSVDYFLSFIATQKEKPLLLPNLSSFGWVCKRYCKLQYIEIMVEKKVRVDGSEIVVRRPPSAMKVVASCKLKTSHSPPWCWQRWHPYCLLLQELAGAVFVSEALSHSVDSSSAA